MEGWISQAALWVSLGIEAAAALIIAVAVAEAAVMSASLLARGARPGGDRQEAHHRYEDVRLQLGRWLVLALEFLLAADILRTAVAPSWNEIGQLAAIAAIRTALNHFLQLEIRRAERSRGGGGSD